MNRTIFTELYDKAFRSGNPIFLFIGINVLVFIALSIFSLGEYLSGGSGMATKWFMQHLAVPADLDELPFKFWTIISYMFVQRDFFHILFNMLWLYWMGRIFMDFLNKKQFIFTYLSGGILGALLYILAFNTIPVFMNSAPNALLLGASASVMAIIVASATLVPNYTIRLLIIGNVQLKYLVLAYFILDILSVSGRNPGGSIAHIGGAIMGFIFIKQLQNGHDLSKLFDRKPALKVVKNTNNKAKPSDFSDQAIIDSILDKISKTGYESLSKTEKEQLFKASKK
jgi:membrane associated rhomboid family serine protease